MKPFSDRLLTILEQHFDKIMELGTLTFIFVFAAVMLAIVHNDELARFIEGGAVITVLARGLGGKSAAPPDPPKEP